SALVFFFFTSRGRHTRSTRDWSSDVCSSDLYGGAVVRVLYLPEDRATWGNGTAVGRTVTALAWLDSLFGTYQWPQLTNVHRIERSEERRVGKECRTERRAER